MFLYTSRLLERRMGAKENMDRVMFRSIQKTNLLRRRVRSYWEKIGMSVTHQPCTNEGYSIAVQVLAVGRSPAPMSPIWSGWTSLIVVCLKWSGRRTDPDQEGGDRDLVRWRRRGKRVSVLAYRHQMKWSVRVRITDSDRNRSRFRAPCICRIEIFPLSCLSPLLYLKISNLNLPIWNLRASPPDTPCQKRNAPLNMSHSTAHPKLVLKRKR